MWNEQQIRRVSAESMVDVRTVKRFLEGKLPVRGISKRRITEAAKALGLKVPRNGR